MRQIVRRLVRFANVLGNLVLVGVISGCSVGWGLIEPGLPKCIYGTVGSGSVSFPTPAGSVTLNGEDLTYISVADRHCRDTLSAATPKPADEPTAQPAN